MPVRVVSGFIECVTVSVPWAALLKESCVVELSGLTVSVAPHRLLKLDEYSVYLGWLASLFNITFTIPPPPPQCMCM